MAEDKKNKFIHTNRRLLFKRKLEYIEIDVNEFFLLFEKIFRLLNTLDLSIKIIGIKLLSDGNDPFDMYRYD